MVSNLCGMRAQAADDPVEQFPALSLPETRYHRDVPEPRVRERPASYGILLSHEHGKIVLECQVCGDEGMMIGEGVLDHLDAAGTQVPEKTARVADSGHGVHRPAAEMLQGLRTRETVQPIGLAPVEGHLQG